MRGVVARVLIGMLASALSTGLPGVSAAEPGVVRWTLEAGTDVALVEDHRAPLVHGIVEFPVGHWSPWATENHAEEAFDIQLYDPAGALRSRADRLSVDLRVGMYSDHASISFSCMTEDLDPVLELVRDVLDNRDFDRSELRRWNKSSRLDWSASLKSPEFRLAQAGARLLYAPGDPRRRAHEAPVPRETEIKRLVAARDTVVRLPGRVIGFAGDLTRAAVERRIAGLLPEVLDRSPEGTRIELGPVTPRERLPAEQIVTMPRISQTFFGYGRVSPTYADPRYPAFLVADHVLGGHFFSRLYQALRHEGGETYGAWTSGQGGPYEVVYAISTFTRGENTAETESKLREVLRRFHAEGIEEEERQAAVGYMLGRRPFSRQSPSQILSRYLWERRYEQPPGFYDDLIDRAARVPLGEINALIRELYEPSMFTMVKVSPR